jgi:hypothetical protein
MSVGSIPAYVIVVPSTTRLPECASVGFETTFVPVTLTVSKPAAPPSTVPLRLEPGAKSKVSLLFAAPVRFSKPVNATPPTLPAPAPVTDQVASPLGPTSVSLPAPPSKATEKPAPARDGSIVNVSSPVPPTSVRLETEPTDCEVDVPSIVTTRSVPETDAEIECDEPPAAVMLTGAGD